MNTSNSMIDCDKMFILDFLALDKMVAEKIQAEVDAYEKATSQQ